MVRSCWRWNLVDLELGEAERTVVDDDDDQDDVLEEPEDLDIDEE